MGDREIIYKEMIQALIDALDPFAPEPLAGFERAIWGEIDDDQPISLTTRFSDIRRARAAIRLARGIIQ